jgi:hypothetical protein
MFLLKNYYFEELLIKVMIIIYIKFIHLNVINNKSNFSL